MNPQEYCRQKTLDSGSSFYYSFYLLPAHRRRAMFALYAFCREVDDIVDNATDINLAQRQINYWQEILTTLETSSTKTPIAFELMHAQQNFGLNVDDLQKIISGMILDLKPKQFQSWEELFEYCDLVAGVVGRLSAQIFGYDIKNKSNINDYATNLGQALQLINILRDIIDDAQIGRVYLPQELLINLQRLAGKSLESQAYILSKYLEHEEYQLIKNSFAEKINKAFLLAKKNISASDYRSQKPGIVMGNIYRELYLQILKSSEQKKIQIGGCKKIQIAVSTLIFNENLRI